MTMTRDELREQLLASLEAAPELPRESRGDLADVFLDELDAQFLLVPRDSRGGSPATPVPTARRSSLVNGFPFHWPYLLLLPLALIVLSFVLHVPFIPFIILLVVAARFARGPMWRRRTPTVWY